ncbi:hypothetical protein [Proteocatella sphenisci]|uniref:hypothetical protein n=1 Tax=Proteocatella sphenisci TaxID=181070 RepID=UPI00048D67DC|nr:hypothetical protein [Proteocatella sphenisci]
MRTEALIGISPTNRGWYNNIKRNKAKKVNYFTNGWEPKNFEEGSTLHLGEQKKIYASGEYVETIKDTVENVFNKDELNWLMNGLESDSSDEKELLKLLSKITGQHLTLNSIVTCLVIDNVKYHSKSLASQKIINQAITYI